MLNSIPLLKCRFHLAPSEFCNVCRVETQAELNLTRHSFSNITTRIFQLKCMYLLQLFWNSMMVADLVKDASSILINMNELLEKALEKH